MIKYGSRTCYLPKAESVMNIYFNFYWTSREPTHLSSTTQIVYSPQYSYHIGRREVVTSANRRATTWHCMKCDVLLCHAGMLGGIQSVTVKKVPLHVLINHLQYEKHTTNRHLSLQSLQTIHLLPILNCSSIIYTLETTMFTADRHIEAWNNTLIL